MKSGLIIFHTFIDCQKFLHSQTDKYPHYPWILSTITKLHPHKITETQQNQNPPELWKSWKWKGEILFLSSFFLLFFRLNQKIKVSKVELNLNVDRQNEIFQSVGKKGEIKAKSLSQNPPLTCCGQGKFKLLLILRRFSMFINITRLVSISLSVVKPTQGNQTNSEDYHWRAQVSSFQHLSLAETKQRENLKRKSFKLGNHKRAEISQIQRWFSFQNFSLNSLNSQN